MDKSLEEEKKVFLKSSKSIQLCFALQNDSPALVEYEIIYNAICTTLKPSVPCSLKSIPLALALHEVLFDVEPIPRIHLEISWDEKITGRSNCAGYRCGLLSVDLGWISSTLMRSNVLPTHSSCYATSLSLPSLS